MTEDAQWEKALVAATVSGDRAALISSSIIPRNVEITSLIVDLKAEDIRRMCDVNILGVALYGMKHAFSRAMRPEEGAAGAGGAVVNVASVAATIAFPAIAVYSGTGKSAVDRMARIGAMEAGKLGYGVRVNCAIKGLAPTEMGLKLAADIVAVGLAPGDQRSRQQHGPGERRLGRLADVSDIADATVFLCSNDARFITGIGLPVDGGMSM